MKTMKLKTITLALMITACGQQQSSSDSQPQSSTTAQKGTISSSIQTGNGSFARLVKSTGDLACAAENADQLIYAKDESKFYYCDGEALAWTFIDIEGPAGKDGTNGADGKNGVDGVAGTNGQDGQDGQDGVAATLVAKYSLSLSSSNTIAGSSATANYLHASLFSDGSIYFSAEVVNSSTIYSPSFFIGASQKANPELTRLTNLILSSKTLAFRTTAGADALTGYTNYGASSTITVGVMIVNNGGAIDTNSMTYFTLAYDNGQ